MNLSFPSLSELRLLKGLLLVQDRTRFSHLDHHKVSSLDWKCLGSGMLVSSWRDPHTHRCSSSAILGPYFGDSWALLANMLAIGKLPAMNSLEMSSQHLQLGYN